MNKTTHEHYPFKLPTSEYPDFSTRLKITMELRNCSIDKLAASTYVSKPTIYGYLNGTRQPNIIILRLIAKTLDVSSDFLIGLKEYIYI